jgi:hypothetical protein
MKATGRCYVLRGFQAKTNRRLEGLAAGWDPLDIVRAEVEAVRRAFKKGVPKGRILRLHEFGDVTSPAQAEALAALAEWWIDEGGGPLFAYTHSWSMIPRRAWGKIIVRASVHTRAEIRVARARGYRLAIVLPRLPRDGRAFELRGTGLRVVPCPGETRHIACTDCMLCMNDEAHIAFEEHGR